MEYKGLSFKLDGPPEPDGRFTGRASVFGNVDLGNDVVEPGAMTKTLQETPVVPLLAFHDPAKPVGVSVELTQTGGELVLKGQLVMEVQAARELYALMAAGAVKGLSIGYQTIKRAYKDGVRHLLEIKLVEISLVVFPMNPQATVTALKAAKGYGLYGDCAEAQTLMAMIGAGLDYLVGEMEEGDTAGATAMQTVLVTLASLLSDELAEVATDAADRLPGDDAYTEAMAEPVRHAIKQLGALLERGEPAQATRTDEDAAHDAKGVTAEPMPPRVTRADLDRLSRSHL